MKTFNFESAKKRYNKLMCSLCLEYLTIGTNFSENTEGWNLRDLISECQYQLNIYYEEGTNQNMLRYSDDEDERKEWMSDTGKLKRFIETYSPYIDGIKCKTNHCSKWDD